MLIAYLNKSLSCPPLNRISLTRLSISMINFFCILVNDINILLKTNNERPLTFIGKNPSEQISEVYRMVNLIDKFKSTIFSDELNTYKKLMATLTSTIKIGKRTEEFTVVKLKEKYGEENVSLIGELGSSKDAKEGIDAEIIVDGKIKTAQIKPFGRYDLNDNIYTLYDTANVKEYRTDWIVFFNKNSGVLVFDNNNTKIVEGNYTIPSTSLMQEIIPIHDELMKLQHDMSTKMINFDVPNSTTLWQAFLAFRSSALIITT